MRALLLASLLLFGCDDAPASPTISVRVISPSGGDPLSEASFSNVRIDVLQEGRPLTTVTETVADGFDLPIEINSFFLPTQVRVRLDGAQTWVGAPPGFVPVASGGLVRIVVGPVGECAIVDDAELTTARDQAATVLIDTFVLSAGGEAPSGPSRAVEFIDLLRFRDGELEDMALGGGAATGGFIGDAKALLITDEGSLIYDLGSEEREQAFTMLHDGADETATAIERTNGVTVVGGGMEATFVWDDGRSAELAVDGARIRPAGASFGANVLIVQGGEPFAEYLEPDGDRTTIDYDDGERYGAIIARDQDALWLLGGTDGAGTPRNDTVSILGCPNACAPSVGPEWEGDPPTAARDDLVIAGDQVFRVSFGAGVWQRELLWTLNARRDGALLIEFESGIVVVVGGSDIGGARPDVEICWPDELRPL